MKKISRVGLGMAVLLWCSCVQVELRDKSPEYREGFRQGAQEAKVEIEEGKMTNYSYGFGAKSGGVCPVTGLPYTGIAGCVVDDFIKGREDGHDQLIYEELGLRWDPSDHYLFDDFGNLQ